jgi:hypothetical protein
MATERIFGVALEGSFQHELTTTLSNFDGLAHLVSPEEASAR